MKKIILILMLLLIMPIAAAALELTDIRGYVNNERVLNVDEDGGDFDVIPGDTIDLIVRLNNNDNTTVQAKLIGTIENIDSNDDIVKTQGYYDIDANDDLSKTISFIIPANARRDDYNLKLKILNGSADTLNTIDYSVIVDISASESASIEEILSNLTLSCNSIADATNTCFGYVGRATNCSNELSTVKEQRGTYQTQADECSSTKTSLESTKKQLQNQLDNSIPIADCNNQTVTAVRAVKQDSDSKFNQTLMFVGGGALFYFYYSKKKKAKKSTASSYGNEYFDHN